MRIRKQGNYKKETAMVRLNYKLLAVVLLMAFAFLLVYQRPDYSTELLLPDWIPEDRKPTDPVAFVIAVLGIIFGITVIILDSRNPRDN